MNFFEAMKMVDEGKTVLSNQYAHYKKIEGKLCQRRSHLDGWTEDSMIESEINGDWDFYDNPKKERIEKPKKEKGLWDSKRSWYDGSIIAITFDPSMDNKGQLDMWADALKTFMELKGHPLATAVLNGVEQYFIFFDLYHEDSKIDMQMFSESKGGYLSPAFETWDDASKAIGDMGNKELIKMAKVFHGIYE